MARQSPADPPADSVIALRNTLRAPARSIMTVLGVAAGVALFVAITAITTDIRKQIANAAGAYNLEVVAYERRANSPFSSRVSAAQIDALRERYGDSMQPLVIGTHNEKWNAYALVIGVTREFLKRVPLSTGAAYDDPASEALVGEIAAERLHVAAGQSVTLDGRNIRITGVYRTGSRLLDGGLMMDIARAQDIITREGAERQYTLALLRAGSGASAESLIAEVNRMYPALKAIPGSEFAGALRLMRVVDAFVRTLSVIALVGTCLVVSNTLIMAIAERTREIGILMTVGWTPWLVLRMLFAESVALCVAGAAVGNVFALVLLRVVNGLDSVGFGWIPIRFSLTLSATSLAMALAVAVVALSWPAVVLYRMQPLTALRHE